MRVLGRPLPSDELLARRLAAILAPDGDVVVLDRSTSGSGTFPKEVVRCRLGDGTERALFCKYAAPTGNSYGHRGGIPYEAEVYARVLAKSTPPTPRFVGAHVDGEQEEHWLILEYLEGGERLKKRPREMPAAARWLGAFHGSHERPEERDDLSFVTVYDDAYYLGWANRTAEYAGHWHRREPWLVPLCERFAEVLPVLVAGHATLIHGEYTVKNVMLLGDEVHPTDWESAAIAVGEIDLMCLVDGWPEETAAECIDAYALQRWGDRIPPGYPDRLAAAELYLHFRWLGEHPKPMAGEQRPSRFDRLEDLGYRFGLLR